MVFPRSTATRWCPAGRTSPAHCPKVRYFISRPGTTKLAQYINVGLGLCWSPASWGVVVCYAVKPRGGRHLVCTSYPLTGVLNHGRIVNDVGRILLPKLFPSFRPPTQTYPPTTYIFANTPAGQDKWVSDGQVPTVGSSIMQRQPLTIHLYRLSALAIYT